MIVLLLVLTLQALGLPKTFNIDSFYYKIDDNVSAASEPGFLKFHIAAKHANYDTEGLMALHQVLREIEMIEKVGREGGSGFMDGAADSIEATGEGFVNLVAHPIESGKGIGKAAGKLGGKIGGVFRKKEEGEKTSFGEKIIGSSKRELAKEFHVDVYSRNPHLQQLLTGMAKARVGGKGAALIGKILLPVAGVVSVALTASGVNSAADQLVNDSNRADLFNINQEALIAMGFSDKDANALLNLSYYTPRESTYMQFYLTKLKGIRGHREILKTAVQSKHQWEAFKILYAAQILADRTVPDSVYESLEVFPEGMGVKTPGRLIFITSYDHLDNSPLGDRVLGRMEELKKKWGAGTAELWNGGKIAPGFTLTKFFSGVKTREWLLFEKT